MGTHAEWCPKIPCAVCEGLTVRVALNDVVRRWTEYTTSDPMHPMTRGTPGARSAGQDALTRPRTALFVTPRFSDGFNCPKRGLLLLNVALCRSTRNPQCRRVRIHGSTSRRMSRNPSARLSTICGVLLCVHRLHVLSIVSRDFKNVKGTILRI